MGYTARMFIKMKNIVTNPASDASPANFAKAEADVKSIISDIHRFAPKYTDPPLRRRQGSDHQHLRLTAADPAPPTGKPGRLRPGFFIDRFDRK